VQNRHFIHISDNFRLLFKLIIPKSFACGAFITLSRSYLTYPNLQKNLSFFCENFNAVWQKFGRKIAIVEQKLVDFTFCFRSITTFIQKFVIFGPFSANCRKGAFWGIFFYFMGYFFKPTWQPWNHTPISINALQHSVISLHAFTCFRLVTKTLDCFTSMRLSNLNCNYTVFFCRWLCAGRTVRQRCRNSVLSLHARIRYTCDKSLFSVWRCYAFQCYAATLLRLLAIACMLCFSVHQC